jgi:NADH-quinone oxidoreductase subunit G
VDDPVLGFTERGSHTTLAVHPDRPLANNYSLNTVDICPVGALTSTDFRFRMRVWFLKETESICTKCARGCNTIISSREGVIHRQEPRENNDVNSAWMCDRGRLDFHFVNSEMRLLQPLIKDGPTARHAPAAWRDALQFAAARLKALAPSQIAIIASGRMTNEEMFLTRQLAKVLGGAAVEIVPRQGEADNYLVHADKNPNTHGARLILTDDPGAQLPAIRAKVASGEIRALVSLHEDLLQEAGFTPAGLSKLDFLLLAHVLANPTAESAHVVLPVATFAEKEGTMINATGRLQRLHRAIPCPGEVRDDWEVLRDLIQAVSGQNGLYSIDDVFRQMAENVSEFSGLSLGGIGAAGIPFLPTGETVPLLDKEKQRRKAGIIVG